MINVNLMPYMYMVVVAIACFTSCTTFLVLRKMAKVGSMPAIKSGIVSFIAMVICGTIDVEKAKAELKQNLDAAYQQAIVANGH